MKERVGFRRKQSLEEMLKTIKKIYNKYFFEKYLFAANIAVRSSDSFNSYFGVSLFHDVQAKMYKQGKYLIVRFEKYKIKCDFESFYDCGRIVCLSSKWRINTYFFIDGDNDKKTKWKKYVENLIFT